MTKEKIFLLIIGLLAAVIVLLLLYELIRKIKNSALFWFLRYFKEGMQQQEEELATTPKSIAGMTKIYEPQIHRDFPEFNWLEFKNKAENMLCSAFLAIDGEDIRRLKDASKELKEQVEIKIQQNQAERIQEHYENVVIHDTEITRYEKKQGKCIVTLQSAVGHRHYKVKNGKVISGKQNMDEQTKYNIEILYVQDARIANGDRAVSMSCPHCGAPVTTLGIMRCEYCGSKVTPVNNQVWSLNKFYEVTYQNI